MADFAFKPYVEGRPDRDDDIATTRSEAVRIREHMKAHGHDARVERSGGGEHRVWIQHPKHKDLAAYVTRADTKLVGKRPGWEPYWIAK